MRQTVQPSQCWGGGVFVDPLVWIQSCLADLSNEHRERWAGCKCYTQTVSALCKPQRYGAVVVPLSPQLLYAI